MVNVVYFILKELNGLVKEVRVLVSKLLKLCNSPLKVSVYKFYIKEKSRGFNILIFERRRDKDGEKTGNDL